MLLSNFAALLLTIILLIAFTIGLNMSLHHVIVFHMLSNEASPVVVPVKPDIPIVNPIKPPPDPADNPADNKPTNIKIKRESHPVHPPAKPFSDWKSDFLKYHEQQTVKKGQTVLEKITAIEAQVLQSSTVHSIALPSSQQAAGELPVLLLTCNRPSLLRQTIQSLLTVQDIHKQQILIIQDGSMAEIASIAAEFGLSLVQNKAGLRLRGGAGSDGASRIAQHYKFALTTGFDRFPKAQAVAIVEDDLLFAPDFLSYLSQAGSLLAADPSLFVVSAWSDNGFKGLVSDPTAIRRTEFFPGLGWLLPRSLYKGQLEGAWPTEHWDHWLRSPAVHQGRECLFPQVPRTYHNGVKGTFMDEATHNRYFKSIATNADPSVDWAAAMRNRGKLSIQSAYEERVKGMVKGCRHVGSLSELFSSSAANNSQLLCLWISTDINQDYNPPFEPVARLFGIWHEHKRGAHRGLHEFFFEGNYLLLLNVHVSVANNYRDLMPRAVQPMSKEAFRPEAVAEAKASRIKSQLHRAKGPGISCDQTCREQGKRCEDSRLTDANSCLLLQQLFDCHECSGSIGSDQPAFVRVEAPTQSLPGHCLFNQDTNRVPITCAASHPDTIRLCVCV